MNKLGLLYLSNDNKIDKNSPKTSAKTKKNFNEMFGKTMSQYSKSLNLSKAIIEESSFKIEKKSEIKPIITEAELKNKKNATETAELKNKIETSFLGKESEKLKNGETILSVALTKNNIIEKKDIEKKEVRLKKEDEIEKKDTEENSEINTKEEKKSSNSFELNVNNTALISNFNKIVKEELLNIDGEKVNPKIIELENGNFEAKKVELFEAEEVELKVKEVKIAKDEELPKDNNFKSVLEKGNIVNNKKLNDAEQSSEVKTGEKIIINSSLKNIENRLEAHIYNEGLTENRIDVKIKKSDFQDNGNEKIEEFNHKIEKKITTQNPDSSINYETKIYTQNLKNDLTENVVKPKINTETPKDSILKTLNIDIKQNFQDTKDNVKMQNTAVKDEMAEKIKVVSVDSEKIINREEKIEITLDYENNAKEKIDLKESIKSIKNEEIVKSTENIEIKTIYTAEKNEISEKITEKEQTITTVKTEKKEIIEKSEINFFEKEKENFEKENSLSNTYLNSSENKVEIRNFEKQPAIYSKKEIENSYAQVENMIKMNFNADTKEMRLKLYPEDLGEVEVKISIEKNIMKAEFLVENEKVKEMIESRFTDLKNALLEKGISTSEINVNISGGSSQDRGYAQKLFYEELGEINKIKKESKIEKNYITAVEKNSAGYNRNLNGSLDITY
jgi:flagellar hook-length control protein FliK